MSRTVVIENSVINSMVKDKRFTDAFPFLQDSIKTVARACGSCGVPSASSSVDYGAIKRSIANMSDAQQNRLKTLLHADQIKITYRANGRMNSLQF